jgi:hypothetical protein
MPTSKRRSTLADHQLALIWGAWAELGVSGWQRTHGDWAIDPEPLIIATAALEDEDPRLRDEALDWCISQWRYVSRVQLKNLLREQPADVQAAWGPFAATVSEHAGVSWPGATERFDYQTTGKTVLDSMERPSRAWLRLRGMFGLGARTEILRFFLSGYRRATVATIAEHARYAKRVVADECDALEKAGVLQSQQVANRFYYRLNRSSALAEFVGVVAPIRPDWPALFRVTSELVALERSAGHLSNGALMVEAHRVAKSLEDDLDALDISDLPELGDPNDHWPAVRDFAERYLGVWARGEWDLDDEEIVDVKSRRSGRRPATSVVG